MNYRWQRDDWCCPGARRSSGERATLLRVSMPLWTEQFRLKLGMAGRNRDLLSATGFCGHRYSFVGRLRAAIGWRCRAGVGGGSVGRIRGMGRWVVEEIVGPIEWNANEAAIQRLPAKNAGGGR